MIIYTDGSCMPNPGPGGWACVILDGDFEIHDGGGELYTTNNKMELKAVIEGIKNCPDNSSIVIYSDSQYVINCATGIWKKSKNLELWDEYNKVTKRCKIIWQKVKAHSGDKYNELVDHLAKKEVELVKKIKKIS